MPFLLYCYLVKFSSFLFLFLYYQFGEIKLYDFGLDEDAGRKMPVGSQTY